MSKHPIRGLGMDCSINLHPSPKYQALTVMCAWPKVTFVALEEIRAFTLTISYGMVYEGLSFIMHGLVGNWRKHHNPLFMAHVKLILEHSVSNLCLDHK